MLNFLWSLIPFVPKGRLSYTIVQKDKSQLMQVFSFILWPLLRDEFMTGYFTTVGTVIYSPRGIQAVPPHIIDHEKEHIRQFRRWGVLYWILYVLALPVGFNPFRTIWEIQGYRAGGTPEDRILEILSGPAYGYTMPKFILRRILKT